MSVKPRLEWRPPNYFARSLPIMIPDWHTASYLELGRVRYIGSGSGFLVSMKSQEWVKMGFNIANRQRCSNHHSNYYVCAVFHGKLIGHISFTTMLRCQNCVPTRVFTNVFEIYTCVWFQSHRHSNLSGQYLVLKIGLGCVVILVLIIFMLGGLHLIHRSILVPAFYPTGKMVCSLSQSLPAFDCCLGSDNETHIFFLR